MGGCGGRVGGGSEVEEEGKSGEMGHGGVKTWKVIETFSFFFFFFGIIILHLYYIERYNTMTIHI